MSGWIESTLESMGYLGVLFLMFLENVFPPIPSELVMPLAGFATSDGRLSLAGVIAAGTAGSVAGAVLIYYLGLWIGEERLRRWSSGHGHWLMLDEKDVERASDWFDRHGRKMIFFGRLIPGVRSLISIPAGIYRMNMGQFLLLTAAGAAIWTALLAWAGKALGERYENIERWVGPIAWVVLGGLAIWYVVHVWRRKKAKRHRDA